MLPLYTVRGPHENLLAKDRIDARLSQNGLTFANERFLCLATPFVYILYSAHMVSPCHFGDRSPTMLPWPPTPHRPRSTLRWRDHRHGDKCIARPRVLSAYPNRSTLADGRATTPHHSLSPPSSHPNGSQRNPRKPSRSMRAGIDSVQRTVLRHSGIQNTSGS
jgi:hypothetical protein